jgi:hypothetical protein
MKKTIILSLVLALIITFTAILTSNNPARGDAGNKNNVANCIVPGHQSTITGTTDLANCTGKVCYPDGTNHSITTGGDGSFMITCLAGGTYSFCFSCGGSEEVYSATVNGSNSATAFPVLPPCPC